jgi:short subunit dehydrogenase-like uncharacterized protein
MSARSFDLLIYGATGFTGRLTARYLAEAAPAGLKWGIAGRDRSKLEALLAELQKDFPSIAQRGVGIVVGHGDTAIDVAKATRVVITTAGPYMLYGEPLVRACIEAGTDYADLTGETAFVHSMIEKYGAQARDKGVALVPMSGFDSVPADLGTAALIDHVHSTYGVGVRKVTGYMRGKGGVSGGTIASGLNMLLQPASVQKATLNPLFLVPSTPALPAKAAVQGLPDMGLPFYVPELKQYAIPFVMAPINTRVVRRSAALYAGAQETQASKDLGPLAVAPKSNAASTAGRYAYSEAGTPFGYAEFMLVRGWFAAWMATLGLGLIGLFLRLPGAVSIARRFVPQPGTGPSEHMQKTGWFQYILIGEVETSASSSASAASSVPEKVVSVCSGGEGGYAETSRMLAEAGILLATQRAALPGTKLGGGFLTPATMFGRALIQRLHAIGIRFDVMSVSDLATLKAGRHSEGAAAAAAAAPLSAKASGVMPPSSKGNRRKSE